MTQEISTILRDLTQELMKLPIKIHVFHGGRSPEAPRKIYPPVIFIFVPAKIVTYAEFSDDKVFGYSAEIEIKDGNDRVKIRVDSRGLTIAPLTKNSKYKHVRVPLPMKVNELSYDSYGDGEFRLVFEIHKP